MELDLEQLYKKYRDNIFAIGLNYFGNPSDADDIVQETFYKLSKSRTDFDSEEHIRNWLIRVAVNVFCKCKFLKFADKNGEFCISVLEKVAGCPAGLPDAS
ncbi:MAG: sigma-70 family RNA polymerase sigma factor [Firmicutes bacterium]|nr:sigma-70 family RNA polymerase sigma factor [Bacillota bacterium]MDY6173628.1 sigma-70 family RNA polymerase sigma factor [Lentihominibacter sp.]